MVIPDVAWLTEAATCDIPAWGLSVASASRAAVASFVNRAITRQAASCWYKACESSESWMKELLLTENAEKQWLFTEIKMQLTKTLFQQSFERP